MDKLKITNIVMGLEKDFHYQLKYNEELILQNKVLQERVEISRKDYRNALDSSENWFIIWLMTFICSITFAIWALNPLGYTYNKFEENDNVEEISWGSSQLQVKWSQSSIHRTNSLLRRYQERCKN